METIIWDWAEENNVIVRLIIEEGSDFKIFCDEVHYYDLEILKEMIEGWHIAFITPDTKNRICIHLYKG